MPISRRVFQLVVSLAAVSGITLLASRVVHVNATTVGFAYLLLILVIASTWGFPEAAVSSVLATLLFNFYFLPPIGTFTIADPQNWVALFSFLAISLIAGRLSAMAKARTFEAIERQRDLERLYGFSRAILLIDGTAPFAMQLVETAATIFQLQAVALFELRSGEFYQTGCFKVEGVEHRLRHGIAGIRSSSAADLLVLDVGLDSGSVARIAIQGAEMPEPVIQGMANLMAVGLEHARTQELIQQVAAARESEQLRTTLIDAMAHEFKTPLTLIKAATTSLLANPDGAAQVRTEQLRTADEEADHLKQLIDDAVEMARLDTAHIEVHPEVSRLEDTVDHVLAAVRSEGEDHPIFLECDRDLPTLLFDQRLMKLALKQLVDNALKYSASEMPVEVRVQSQNGTVALEVTDHGEGIPVEEQNRIFDRFYRSPSVKDHIPGSGLGLSIAHRIVQAHNGDLSVSSGPGRTTFRLSLTVPKQETL